MLDTDPYNTNNGDGAWKYRNYGTTDLDGYQGISARLADRRATVIITDHPGRAGYGPLTRGAPNTKKADEIEK